MARAKTRTWLPLDTFAEIMGLPPLYFNGLVSSKYSNSSCGELWRQYAWQNADRVSREDLAVAIRQAEQRIAQHVGYFLLPDWVNGEEAVVPLPARQDVYFQGLYNARGRLSTVEAKWGHVIQAGYQVKQSLAELAIVYSDADGDGYDELATVTVPAANLGAITDPCDLRVYYPGHDGADAWEIRPITATISGGIGTVTFKAWQAVKESKFEGLDAGDINGDDASNYLSTVDVYRVYTSPATQGTLIWSRDPECSICNGSGCSSCQITEQDACLILRNKRLGLLAYTPGTYSASDDSVTAADLAIARRPDKVKLYYLAGWQDPSPDAVCPRNQMDPSFAWTVAVYACALLDRPICSCNNAEMFIDRWRTDMARQGAQVSYTMTEALASNPFGTMAGAIEAWRFVNQDGRVVHR